MKVAGSLECRRVSLATFLASTNPETRPVKVVVGVVVLAKEEVLLLQRSATELHFPNIWELPSGKVESEDPTLLDAATRECFEETGMTVIEFIEETKSFEYVVEGRGLTLQLNFIAGASGNVVINQEEHKRYKWRTETEVEQLGVTDSTRKVFREVFEAHRRKTADLCS
jgi:8-oxo-dGTP pyrophosphatase MutT (NUDIX family)